MVGNGAPSRRSLLHAQHVDDVQLGQDVESRSLVTWSQPRTSGAGGSSVPGATAVGLAAHDLKGGDQRAADAGVRDIANDADLQTVEVTLVLPDGVQVEQGLRGMVVLAVAGVR